jgi:hypothetical protein
MLACNNTQAFVSFKKKEERKEEDSFFLPGKCQGWRGRAPSSYVLLVQWIRIALAVSTFDLRETQTQMAKSRSNFFFFWMGWLVVDHPGLAAGRSMLFLYLFFPQISALSAFRLVPTNLLAPAGTAFQFQEMLVLFCFWVGFCHVWATWHSQCMQQTDARGLVDLLSFSSSASSRSFRKRRKRGRIPALFLTDSQQTLRSLLTTHQPSIAKLKRPKVSSFPLPMHADQIAVACISRRHGPAGQAIR